MNKRRIPVRRHYRKRGSSTFVVRRHMRQIHKRSTRKTKPQGFQKILSDASKDSSMWAQPVRVQPTKDILKQVDEGKLKASKQTVNVNPKYRSYYGRSKVPASVVMPTKDGRIVEIFMEDISKDMKGSGTKIIGERTDKKRADSMDDIERIYKTFYG